MTEQHECEWEADILGVRCSCGRALSKDGMVVRLNEYETLKKATEALSAENAKFAVKRIEDHIGYEQDGDEGTMFALDAYADILEDK